jgi:homoserine/homoserine lactone efflux protein
MPLAMQMTARAFLIVLGLRGLVHAKTPVTVAERPAPHVFLRAFAIATINPKSVAGYLAAFSQFVQPGVPIWDQMVLIFPTALTITALSYTGFTAIGAGLGRAALAAVFHTWVRRAMALCFIVYGVLLGSHLSHGEGVT